MNDRRVGLLAGVTTVLVGAAKTAPEFLASTVAVRDPAWLPQFGSTGETVTVYLILAGAVAPLLTWTLALGLGYHLGRDVDATAAYRPLLRALAVGSGATVALGVGVGFLWTVVSGAFDTTTALTLLAGLLRALFSFAVPVVVGGFAGALFRSLAAGRDTEERAVATASEEASERPAERVREHAVEDAD